ncbi:MAG TPA: hypothetical protein VG457_06155 [Planctomycetota bacterium]|jgi:hypothetical protein|nr:hypothetical protein [Planctomycetota bacterium]
MRPTSPYFVNAPVDILFIGGLSIATALAFWGLESAGRPLPGAALALGLAWVVNWPHFSASSYRLYHSKSNLAQYPVTAIAVPLLLVAGVVGALLAPQTAGSAMIKLYLLWSPFHFSGQSRGVTLIYARRLGLSLGRLDRLACSGFFYASYFRLILGQESATGLEFLGGLGYPLFGVPAWLASGAQALEVLFGIAVLLVFARHGAVAGRLRLPILLLPAVTQFVWFEAGSRIPEFNALVPFFHSLQYLLIAWAMQLRERKETVSPAIDGHFVRRETARWWILNVAGGAALFWALPAAATWVGVPSSSGTPILFAAVQIHHFFVDGVIWKLRNPRVASPLLVNLSEPEAFRPAPGSAV